MLVQFLALVGLCLVNVYAVSFILSFTSYGKIRSVVPSDAAPFNKPLSLEAAKRLPSNATGSYALQGAGTLYFPDSCHRQLCILTLKGAKGLGTVPNQDRSLTLHKSSQLLLALFDGHGDQGHEASAAAVRDLPFRILLAKKLRSVSGSTISFPSKELLPPSYYKQAFLDSDAGPVSRIPYAGTTGIVVHYDTARQRLVLASVGDSTCLVVKGSLRSNSSQTILLESIKHKPALPEERKRIEAKGGRVYIPANPASESSRVLIPGPMGPESYALAMSRSLGDVEGKQLGYLTAEPDVRVLDLNGQYQRDEYVFVVVASDGVLDVINKQSLIQQLVQALRSNTLPEACKRLMNQAVQGWNEMTGGVYRDDVTLMVSKLPLRYTVGP
jgi:serine/threonine protein phosphatase PrpC